MEKVTLPNGTVKTVLLKHFPALDGWDIQDRYIKYVRSDDAAYKRAFTIEVLSYSEIVLEEMNLPMITAEVIQNHLVTWQNIKQIFEAVLVHNGIDPESHAQKEQYWDHVGAQLAISFIAEASKLIGPAINLAAEVQPK